MAIPKWMYRKNPVDGSFQSSKVTTEGAALELAADGWTDDPSGHGFEIELVPFVAKVTDAQIHLVMQGDQVNG